MFFVIPQRFSEIFMCRIWINPCMLLNRNPCQWSFIMILFIIYFIFSILGEVRLRRGASVINWNTMKRRNFFIVFVLESCKLVQ